MTQPSSVVATGDERVTTATAVVVDDRPMIRAGMLAVLGEDAVLADGELNQAAELVELHRPDVVIVMLRGDLPEPYRTIATVKALRGDVHVLALADEVTAADLREAVVAGADGFLLTKAPLPELRDAVAATARGERVVSPEVAVHLVGTWRNDADAPQRAQITQRELDVLRLLAEGLTNAQAADRLGLSPRTVKTHVQNLLTKLDAPDRTGVVARAFRLGLIR